LSKQEIGKELAALGCTVLQIPSYFCFASGVAGLVVVFTQQLQTSPHALSLQNQKYFGGTNARFQGNYFNVIACKTRNN
jgi:hypothetical protein